VCGVLWSTNARSPFTAGRSCRLAYSIGSERQSVERVVGSSNCTRQVAGAMALSSRNIDDIDIDESSKQWQERQRMRVCVCEYEHEHDEHEHVVIDAL
jgi:hypothetical protein